MTREESKDRICKNCKHYFNFETNGIPLGHVCKRSTWARECEDKSRGNYLMLAAFVDENDTCDKFEKE